MKYIKISISIMLLGLVLAFVGVNLLAMGAGGPVSTVLLIASLYVVMAAVGLLLVAVWRMPGRCDGDIDGSGQGR